MASSPLANCLDLSALPAGQAKFALIKSRVEAALEKKVPSALTVRERPTPPLVPFGIAEVDALLCGGLPRGALAEITGPVSSGRTSLLHSLLAATTAREEFCALVDASGSFDPASAAAAGVELSRVLWVKCSAAVPAAVARASRSRSAETKMPVLRPLDRVLRVADLLLASGGFGLVALDLADLSPDIARRVPLTTWFRFRRIVEGTPATLVVLEQEAHAKSCAAVVLQLHSPGFQLQCVTQDSPTHTQLLTGCAVRAELVRGHAQKKMAMSSRTAQFSTQAAWAI